MQPVCADRKVHRQLRQSEPQRLTAEAGPLALRLGGVVRDSGRPDETNLSAKATPLAEIPADALPFLMASRYCETDLLSSFAWSQFGGIPEGWARVQAICDYVHGRLRFSYPEARETRTAAQAMEERIGVCRDFTHLAIALCRCMNIPARFCNGYLGDIGVPPGSRADGLQRLVRSLSRRPLVHVRCPPQPAAHRPDPHCARARRRGRRDDHVLRAAPPFPLSPSLPRKT